MLKCNIGGGHGDQPVQGGDDSDSGSDTDALFVKPTRNSEHPENKIKKEPVAVANGGGYSECDSGNVGASQQKPKEESEAGLIVKCENPPEDSGDSDSGSGTNSECDAGSDAAGLDFDD